MIVVDYKPRSVFSGLQAWWLTSLKDCNPLETLDRSGILYNKLSFKAQSQMVFKL